MKFKRDIYSVLLKWTNNEKALLLQGPRQVGKTFILHELAKEQFVNMLYVNLGSESVTAWFSDNGDIYDDRKWADLFALYAKHSEQHFDNSKETLVILDEVQNSSKLFSGIRGMVRSCHFKVAATGSYLGLMNIENYYANRDKFFYAAGDMMIIDMYPMTYLEVIQAANEYGVEDVERICKFYLQYGGFPDVVAKWLETDSFQDCIEVLEFIYLTLIRESQKYFVGPFPTEVWTDTLISVVAQIETKKAVLMSEELVLKFRESNGIT